jgi:hypothetical protein
MFIHPYLKEIATYCVNIIDEVRNKSFYIDMESKKELLQKGQEGTSNIKVKKIIAITKKRRDPNRNEKHYDAYGNMDEKC